MFRFIGNWIFWEGGDTGKPRFSQSCIGGGSDCDAGRQGRCRGASRGLERPDRPHKRDPAIPARSPMPCAGRLASGLHGCASAIPRHAVPCRCACYRLRHAVPCRAMPRLASRNAKGATLSDRPLSCPCYALPAPSLCHPPAPAATQAGWPLDCSGSYSIPARPAGRT